MNIVILFDFPAIMDENKEIHPHMVYTTKENVTTENLEDLLTYAIDDLRKNGLGIGIPLNRLPMPGSICTIRLFERTKAKL